MGKIIGTVSTDDSVVYDLSEKVWNFRFGTWGGRVIRTACVLKQLAENASYFDLTHWLA